MVQVPSIEEFQALVKRVDEIAEENAFLKSLLLGKRWISRNQAMRAIGCRAEKLRLLKINKILTPRYEGKSPRYDVFDIRIYLTAQNFDSKEVEKRILNACFEV